MRRAALGRVVAEAGHMVVDTQDAADVVLVDGDCPPGETRPVVALGGADDDLSGVLPRDADAKPDRCRDTGGRGRPDRPFARRQGRRASARCARPKLTRF